MVINYIFLIKSRHFFPKSKEFFEIAADVSLALTWEIVFAVVKEIIEGTLPCYPKTDLAVFVQPSHTSYPIILVSMILM